MIIQCAACFGQGAVCAFCGTPRAIGSSACGVCHRRARAAPCDGRVVPNLATPAGEFRLAEGQHFKTELHCDCCGIVMRMQVYSPPAGWDFHAGRHLAIPRSVAALCPECAQQLRANVAVAWDTLLVQRAQSRLGATWDLPAAPADSGRDYCDQCGTPFSYGCIHTTTTARAS